MGPVKRAADVIWRCAPHYLVLARPGTPPLVVSGGASELWNVLDEHDRSVEEICTLMAARLGTDEQAVRPGLRHLLERLTRAGYVVP